MPEPIPRIVAEPLLATSEESVFAAFADVVPLRGADVLEIGGATPPDLLRERGVRTWFAVDPRHPVDEAADGPLRRIRGRAETVPLTDLAVDAVFSSNALQFVDLPEVLGEVRRVLRPGGVLYAHFGPIWSGPDGHQLEYVTYRGRELVFWRDCLLPPYAHLTHGRDELRALLVTGVEAELAELVVRHVHDGDTINRLFFEDYAAAVGASGLECVELVGSTHLDYPLHTPAYAPELLREPDLPLLSARLAGPGGAHRALGVRDVLLVARRLAGRRERAGPRATRIR